MAAALAEEALLRRVAQSRDREAFAALYERYQRSAFGLARCITRDSALAEDVVQEALWRVWEKADHFQSGTVKAWLLKIVANCAIRAAGRREGGGRGEGPHGRQETHSGPVTPDLPPERLLLREEERAVLNEALGQLADPERFVVALYYGAGMTLEQIGRQLGIPVSTVSFRRQQALVRLRSRLVQAGLGGVVALGRGDLEGAFEALTGPAGLAERILARVGPSDSGGSGGSGNLGGAGGPGGPGGPGGLEGSGVAGVAGVAGGTCGTEVGVGQRSARWPALLAALIAIGSLAGGLGLWLGTRGQGPARSSGSSNSGQGQGARPLAAAVAATEFDLRWEFSEGPSPDLSPIQGRWSWQRSGDGRGVMVPESPPGVVLLLPVRLPARPFELSFRLQEHLSGSGATGATFSDGNGLCGRRLWRRRSVALDPDGGSELRFLVLGRFQLGLRAQAQELFAVCEYESEYPSDRIAIWVKGHTVREIRIRTLAPEQIPSRFRDADLPALLSGLQNPVREDARAVPFH